MECPYQSSRRQPGVGVTAMKGSLHCFKSRDTHTSMCDFHLGNGSKENNKQATPEHTQSCKYNPLI